MNIGIASDHGGYLIKQKLTEYLKNKGYNVIDCGTNSIDSVDYPDYAFKLCEKVIKGEVERGIAICKTGIGMSIACNKVKGIRCAKVTNSNEAKLCRLHNNANVIAIGADLSMIEIKDIMDNFLQTNFSEEDRHINRINKITKYEEEHER